MLVLDRKVQEGFWIDGGIFVKVLEIGRRRVKLGIEAPRELQILRQELTTQVDGEAPAERDLPVPEERVNDGGSSRPVRRRGQVRRGR